MLTLREALDAVWMETERRSAHWQRQVDTLDDPATRTRLADRGNVEVDAVLQTLTRVGRLLGIQWKPGQ